MHRLLCRKAQYDKSLEELKALQLSTLNFWGKKLGIREVTHRDHEGYYHCARDEPTDRDVLRNIVGG